MIEKKEKRLKIVKGNDVGIIVSLTRPKYNDGGSMALADFDLRRCRSIDAYLVNRGSRISLHYAVDKSATNKLLITLPLLELGRYGLEVTGVDDSNRRWRVYASPDEFLEVVNKSSEGVMPDEVESVELTVGIVDVDNQLLKKLNAATMDAKDSEDKRKATFATLEKEMTERIDMGVKILDIQGLPKTNEFTGTTLPSYKNGKYVRVDLEEYHKYFTKEASEKLNKVTQDMEEEFRKHEVRMDESERIYKNTAQSVVKDMQEVATSANAAATSANAATSSANAAATSANAATSSANVAAERASVAAEGTQKITAEAIEVTKRADDVLRSVENYGDRLAANEEIVQELTYGKPNYVAASWGDESRIDPRAEMTYGNPDAIPIEFKIMDMADNEDDVAHVRYLKRDNILRYKNNSYAPAVGITQEMYNECMCNELYINGELYCESGQYDPVNFRKNHCKLEKIGDVWQVVMSKLTKADGDEVSHYLMPWETPSRDYNIHLGPTCPIYFSENTPGQSGKRWSIVSRKNINWDGINLIKLATFSISPSAPTTNSSGYNSGLSRCQFHLYQSGTTDAIMPDRGYPRNTMGVNENVDFCRGNNANNDDKSKAYPFAEGGDFQYNAMITLLELSVGTRALSYEFGSGQSYNSDMPSDADKFTWDEWDKINRNSPVEACMESQTAFSWAREFNIPEDEKFEMYGYVYRWRATIRERLPKMTAEILAYKDLPEVIADRPAVLRFSLYDGLTCSGDVFQRWQGGREIVSPNITNGGEGGGGGLEPVETWGQSNPHKWHNVRDMHHEDGSAFAFMLDGSYVKQGELDKSISTYSGNNFANSPLPKIAGSSLSTGMCQYNWATNWFNYHKPYGTLSRRCVLRRGHLSHGNCSPRSLFSNCSASNGDRDCVGSSQSLDDEPTQLD